MKSVRFLKDFDYRPDPNVIVAYKKGSEVDVIEAVIAAAPEGVLTVLGPAAQKPPRPLPNDSGSAEPR